GIEEDDYDSERDIIIREELLDNYSLSLPVIESHHFDIPSFSRPPVKPPDGNTGILNVKMMGDISDKKLSAKCPMMIHRKNIPILDVPLFHFYPLDQFNEFNPIHNEDLDSTLINDRFDTESYLLESLLNRDTLMASSLKIDSLLAEFTGELIFLNSIPPGIDVANCDPEEDIHLVESLLYDNSSPLLPEEFVYENSNADIESFSPSPIPIKDSDSFMEEINLSFTPDDPMPPCIEEDDYKSKRDIRILEELLDNYSLSLPVIESYHFDIPSFSRPPAKPPDGNTGILNINMMGDISDQKVPMPRLTITRVSNQEKSPDLLSHRSLKIFQLSAKCPMMIHGKNIPILDVPLFHFYPLDQLKYGGIGSNSVT
nr:hypothetical protein [Tanacetum cinerariifolium]